MCLSPFCLLSCDLLQLAAVGTAKDRSAGLHIASSGKYPVKNQTPGAPAASPGRACGGTCPAVKCHKENKTKWQSHPLTEGIPLCFQAVNDKLSKAVPSPWPASLKPPLCQHPPSPSSRVGPFCDDNTRGEERRRLRERERGETGAGGGRGKGGRRVLKGIGGKGGDGQ